MDRIGILAGGGRLPLMIAESAAARGGRVHIVGIDGEADPGIARFPHTWVNWGQIDRMVATLRAQGGSALVIAGGVRRPDLWKLRPDAGLFLSLPQIVGLLAGGDDSVLSRVVRFFEAKGFRVLGAHEVAPDLLAGAGRLGAVAFSPDAHADAGLGFAVRAALGPLDAGQAVVVARGRVLAIEGAEGTDAMLERAAALHGRSGARAGVLTKGPKPGQELRVDMPAIGARTVDLAAAAGLQGMAVEAGAVLVLGREEAIRTADARGMAVQGLPGVPVRDAHAVRQGNATGRVLGRLRPGTRDRADAAKGLTAVTRLAPFAPGAAVVVARAYILAFAVAEPTAAMLDRVHALRQWGLRGSRRVGVLVCRCEDRDWDAAAVGMVLERAAAQGLAGVAVTGPAAALVAWEEAARLADAHRLFLVACPQEPGGPA